MSTWLKLAVCLACVAAYVLLEQTGMIRCYSSRSISTTSDSSSLKPATGDLVSTVRVQKPMTRWLPFFKYGETVFFRTYQYPADNPAKIVELDSTTRTRLFVIGFCSTAKYDELARAPFEEAYKEYQKNAEQAALRHLKPLR